MGLGMEMGVGEWGRGNGGERSGDDWGNGTEMGVGEWRRGNGDRGMEMEGMGIWRNGMGMGVGVWG